MGKQKDLNPWIFAAWFLGTFVWIGSTGRQCLPSYYVDYNEVVNYADLLYQHSAESIRLNNPLLAYSVSLVVGVVLLYRTRQWWIGIILLMFGACACGVLIFGSVFCDQTTLHHLETVEFDGSTYHLTLGDDIAGGADVFSQILFLHQCEQSRENCRGRAIAKSYFREFDQSKLMIDVTNGQLQVISDDEVLFTLDGDVVPISIP